MMLKKSASRADAGRLDELLRAVQVTGQPRRSPEPAGQGESQLASLVAVARRLETLRPVPALPASALSSARQTLLAQAAQLRSQTLRSATLSPAARLRRLADWLAALFRPVPFRRTFAPGLAAVLLVLFMMSSTGLALSSLGMASQASLPGDRFYAYKIAQEDLGLALTMDAADRIALYLELAENRSQELLGLVQAGRPAPVETVARLQQHFQSALYIASQLPDAQMETALEQICQGSLNSQNILAEAEELAPDDQSRLALSVAASALTTAGSLAEEGLEDPQSFRLQMGSASLLPSGTPVGILPTATSILFNPPVSPEPTSTPSATGLPAGSTYIPATATATSTPDNPPTIPATPSATSVMVGSTPVSPTATRTPSPTATQTPQPPPPPATPTLISP